MRKMERLGCGRIVRRLRWCRPGAGTVKINWAVGGDGRSCGFFVRDSKGMFCAAGTYALKEGQEIKELLEEMLVDCWRWCVSKNITRMIVK